MSLAPMRASAAPQSPETWTIMFYMAGDAEPALPWEDDVNEMEMTNLSDNVNIIALVDGYGDGNSILLKIAHDPNGNDPRIVSATLDDMGAVVQGHEANMGSSVTLGDFIEYAATNYPADRLVLDLWGHGGAWLGLCLDGTDALTLPELRHGLMNATAAIGRTLDMVVIDSCYEGTVEIMSEIHPFTNLLLASENVMSSFGMHYDLIISGLLENTSQTPFEFGKEIVDSYIRTAWYSSSWASIMAMFDMAKVPDLMTAMDSFSQQGTRYDGLFDDTLYRVANETQSYYFDFNLDLGDLMRHIIEADVPLELKESAMNVLGAYQSVASYVKKLDIRNPADGAHVENATGAAIYCRSGLYYDWNYTALQIRSNAWYDFGSYLCEDGYPVTPGGPPQISTADSLSDIDALDDYATINWSGSMYDYDSFDVWVYGVGPNGLELLEVIHSASQVVTVSGVFGNLRLSASASIGVDALSYIIANITLHGQVVVNFDLRVNGDLVSGGYDLLLVSSKGVETLEYNAADNSTSWSIPVPDFAVIGELVRVDVLNASDNQKMGTFWTYLEETNNSWDIQVSYGTMSADESPPTPIPAMALVGMAVGVVIIAAAFLLLTRTKRTL
jgi:hypothetical protein